MRILKAGLFAVAVALISASGIASAGEPIPQNCDLCLAQYQQCYAATGSYDYCSSLRSLACRTFCPIASAQKPVQSLPVKKDRNRLLKQSPGTLLSAAELVASVGS